MLPSLFISHGSPMLALEPGESGPALAHLAAQIRRPKAIVIVSAHWESDELLVSANPRPRTRHDFGGFPRCNIPRRAIPNWQRRSPTCSTPRSCRHAWRPDELRTMASGCRCR